MIAQGLHLQPLLAAAARLYRSAFAPVALVSCLFALPYAAADSAARRLGLSFLDSAQLRGSVQLVLGMAGSVAVARLYLLAATREENLTLLAALRVAARRWPAGLAVGLVSGLAMGIGTALLVVPGVIVALNLSMALPLLAATDLDANQVLRRSAALVLGHRKRLFPTFAIAWLATAALSTGVEQVAEWLAGALAHPVAGFAIDFGYEAAAGMLEAGLTAVLVAAYLGLVPTDSAREPGAGPAKAEPLGPD
ncbi:MAG TPA: hypothetical protein VGK67_27390 [Myxococcales bacterium]